MVIGEVGRAHGVHGALRVRPTGATLATLGAGDVLTLVTAAGGRVERAIASIDARGDALTLRLEGVEDRTAAEALRGAFIVVPETALPALAGDEFYVRDMIGCDVRVGGRPAGRVADVLPGAANDVLDVRDAAGRPLLVPFTRDALTRVDLDARVIDVRDGLLDEAGG